MSKRKGKEFEDVLEGDSIEPNVWDTIKKALGGPAKETKINIFSVASGHLY